MNMLSLIDQFPKLRGHITLFSVNPVTQAVSQLVYSKNKIMDGASLGTAKLWGGVNTYKPGAIYFEFQNLASPGDTPEYPTFEHTEGVEYYTGLDYSTTKDFLRVPILVSPNVINTVNGYLLTLYAISPDVDVGFWEKPFTGASNSVVIGGAVVATPTGVQSDDVILCRSYPTGTKIFKTTGEQIGITWNVEFPYPLSES